MEALCDDYCSIESSFDDLVVEDAGLMPMPTTAGPLN
jgi:hypothetical protein